MREHHFTLTVRTTGSKRSAEQAVLTAFGRRQPDACEFYLRSDDGQKNAYMAGSLSGMQLGFELGLRAIEDQMKHLKVKRGLV